jgi:hypothetical protein
MNRRFLLLHAIVLMAVGWMAPMGLAGGQDRNVDPKEETSAAKPIKKESSGGDTKEEASQAIAPERLPDEERAHDRAELEKEFEQMLTGAVLVGVWQMTAGLEEQAPLSPPREERYEISRARKMTGDHWLIFARIHYADKDVTIPVPVRILWAGDTAVLTLDDVGLPMLGTYSARVTFHRGFYNGIWYSNVKNYGGVMMGRIEKKDKESEGSEEAAPERSPAVEETNKD